uniref:Uncharacterized protein n=1 Tax=Solanum tuberosum TaxID=4113 RepID=M1DHQ2_SOLTU
MLRAWRREKRRKKRRKKQEFVKIIQACEWNSSGVIPIKTQVTRINIQHIVDPVEHSRVSDEPPCIPESSAELSKPGQGSA